jgi:hypothetical protein
MPEHLISRSSCRMNPRQSSRPLVYLCGAIGNRTLGDALGWREHATRLLAPELGVLSPLRDSIYGLNNDSASDVIAARETASTFTDAELVQRDLMDIQRAFLVLRHYTGSSEGSPMECAYARMFGVPVVVSGIEDPSAMSPWLRYHSVRMLPTLEDAVAYVKRYWLYPSG